MGPSRGQPMLDWWRVVITGASVHPSLGPQALSERT
jgi:hypothetical protein